MRTLLFTGKGGVGKTTLAAATGAWLASLGRKTLVVSTDPAHSLGDAFGLSLGPDPSEVDTLLYAVQIDSRGLVDNAWQELRTHARSVLTGIGIDVLDAEELTVLPGVDELLALTEMQRLVETGPWESVVVDCGPTAETLRLLALPEAVSGYLGRAGGWRSRLNTAGRRWHDAIDSMQRLSAHVESLRDLLTDPKRTTVRLVLTPERVVVAETRRTLSSLALRGIRVDGLLANRLMPAQRPRRLFSLPGGSSASWMRAQRSRQDAVLAELARSGMGGQWLRTVEYRTSEPVGLAALSEIADELYADNDPLAGAGGGPTPLLDVAEVDDGYQLTIAVPLAATSTIDLARVDDDLAITVDGYRRLIGLPELLRPCRITGAESDSDGLTVFLAQPREPR